MTRVFNTWRSRRLSNFLKVAVCLVSLVLARPAFCEPESKNNDAGFLFQDEVTNEIRIDLKENGSKPDHAFSDLEGQLKPGSLEYQALIHVTESQLLPDKNVEIKSLTLLRNQFDLALNRLKLVANDVAGIESKVQDSKVQDSQLKVSAQGEVDLPGDLQFSRLPESGYTNPLLTGYRLVPLESGAMLVSEGGEKRVFGFRESASAGEFEVSVARMMATTSLLALRRNDSVWLIHLSRHPQGIKIDWSKRIEFGEREERGRLEVGEHSALSVRVSDESIEVRSGSALKRLAAADGAVLPTAANVSIERSPASEDKESSIVRPIE